MRLRALRHREAKRRHFAARVRSAAKVWSEMLWAASRRKGFMRRYMERIEAEKQAESVIIMHSEITAEDLK